MFTENFQCLWMTCTAWTDIQMGSFFIYILHIRTFMYILININHLHRHILLHIRIHVYKRNCSYLSYLSIKRFQFACNFYASSVIYIHLYLTYIHILCIYIYIYRCTCTFTGTNIRMYINRTFLEVRSSQPLAQTICPNQSQSPKVIMRPPPVWRASCSRWCAGKVNLANLPVMY